MHAARGGARRPEGAGAGRPGAGPGGHAHGRMGAGATPASGTGSREFECVIYGVATTEPARLVARVHALCDDGCLTAPSVHVEESVFVRQETDKALATLNHGIHEVRVRRVAGDQLDDARGEVCASGTIKRLTEVDAPERWEVMSYGLYQRSSIERLGTPVRSMVRIPAAGDVHAFLKQMGYVHRYTTSYSGSRVLTRDGVEVEMLRPTAAFRSASVLVPNGCATVDSAPLVVTLRCVAPNEAEIERCAKRVRDFVTDLAVSSPFEEFSPETFLPRGSIR